MSTHDGSSFWPARDGLSPDILKFLSPRETPDLNEAVIAGAKAGAPAAAMAAGLLMYAYVRQGGSALLPVRIFALQLCGDAGFAGSALGIVLSVLVSIAGGAAFGAFFGLLMSKLVGRLGLLATVGVGAVYGVLVWMITQFVVIAYLAPQALLLYNQHTLALSFAVYGACLGLLGGVYRSRSWFV